MNFIKCIIILLTGMCISCTTQDNFDNSDEQIILSFTYGVSNTGAGMEGEISLNETVINRVDLLFYNQQTCVYYPSKESIKISDGKIIVNVDNDKKYIFDNVTKYKIIAIANNTLARDQMEGKSLDEIEKLIVESDFSKNAVQTDFVMYGQTENTLSLNNPNMGKIDLFRLACKIAVKISSISIPSHIGTNAYAKIISQTNTSSLQDPEYESPYNSLTSSEIRQIAVGNQQIYPIPFYSYKTSWDKEIARKSYILLEVPLTSSSDQTQNYYYKVPFVETLNGVNIFANRLLSNYFYSILVNINILGGNTPETAQELKTNYQIIDWSTNNIIVDINNFKYIDIDKSDFEMLNTTQEVINVNSNVDLQISNVKAHCQYINEFGQTITKTYSLEDIEYPSIVYNKESSTININSTVPDNYLSKNISFQISSTDSKIYRQINIVQQPPIVISSLWSESSNSITTNQNLYKIRIITPLANTIIGDPTTIINGQRYTKTTEEGNKYSSPEFIISIENRNMTNLTLDAARIYCASYKTENYNNPYWRVPSKAELGLLMRLQNEAKSPIKGCFGETSNLYWCAQQYVAYDCTENTFKDTYYYDLATVRCVYDNWK